MSTLRTRLAAALAVIACPCHVPLLLVLLAGTTFGAGLASYTGLLYGVMTAVFVGALVFLFARTNRTSDAPSTPPAPAAEERCEDCTGSANRANS